MCPAKAAITNNQQL